MERRTLAGASPDRKVARTTVRTLSRMPAEQKGAYSPQPLTLRAAPLQLKVQEGCPRRGHVQRQDLLAKLAAAFDSSERTRRAVARQAGDLADSGRLEEDMDVELTAETVVANLEDAPDGYSLVQRWNWWIGSLELSFGGYQRFSVRTDLAE